MSDDFPAYALSEGAPRRCARRCAPWPTTRSRPRAADIDRTSEFPWDVYEALVKADFQAVHIPSRPTAAPGADAIATAIVIEEVARACASSVARSPR